MQRTALKYITLWAKRATRKPLVIRGARQVGKSYLVRMLAEKEFTNLLEVNFERDPADAAFFMGRSPSETIALLEAKYQVSVQPGKTLLFLDEIQAAPQVFARLRYFYEERPDLHTVTAGSLLDFTLADPQFSMPVGRIEYLHLGPMDFEEFLCALGRTHMLDILKNYQPGQDMPLHSELLALVKQYWIVGGMPEAVKVFVQDRSYRECDSVKQTLLDTIRDDFSKYGGRVKHDMLSKVLVELPKKVGRKWVYSQIDSDVRSPVIKKAFEQLCLARIATKIRHSNANGIPLGAESSDRNFKPLFLDVGLMCRACSLSITDVDAAKELTLINSGALAEQYVGQHMLYDRECYEDPELYCWMRQKRTSNAEVDYLLAMGQTIIPVEVKAGKTGSLKSLHFFLCHKQRHFALRFNAAPPSVMDARTSVAGTDPKPFRLLSLPFYLIGQTRRLCQEAM